MDVVYVVRLGDRNEPLRWSLRSLTNVPHDRVWLAGHCPPWVAETAGWVPVEQAQRARWTNVRENLRAACSCPDVSDPFLLFNDDFYAVEPVTEVPVMHRGPVERWLQARKGGTYAKGLQATVELLAREGIEGPLNYGCHVPLPVRKGPMLDALDVLDRLPEQAWHVRTFYGNRERLGGVEIADPKVYTASQDPPEGPWVSTDSPSWSGRAGQHVRDLFPDPSPYEREAPDE